MIGVFCVLMWYLLLLLYLKQIKAIFGTYEPITYKAACALWGSFFIATGIVVMKASNKQSLSLLSLSLFMNLVCIAASVAALVLTVVELKDFPSVSYKNYGQAPEMFIIESITVLASLKE
ncbi:membrane-spanning 4-domains subfamily A member 13 [Sorex araneus]|uniref:membrane-spanning 4-domains subfamily A member 13 n=1 Tax=Sorex araneus TaxID=42254 RepID=UPI0003317757|nr:membrane-spanning 4-domains subfamily A member 13 [Sorex araneus]